MSDITQFTPLDLPYDLIAHILIYLRSDNRSLRHCAEVSRAWLWPARTHLFHHIHVSNGMVWDSLESSLESAPDIGSLVRIFSISDLKHFLFDAIYRDKVVCKALTAIEDLRISNVAPSYPLDIASDALGLTSSHLSLHNVDMKSTQDLFRIVSVRSQLTHVTLHEVRLRNPSPGALLDGSQLRTIVLDGYTIEMIMRAEGIKLNLRPQSLTIQSITDDDVLPLARLLKQVGGTLEYLRMGMHTEIVESVWNEVQNEEGLLSHASCLRTLMIENPASSIFRLAPVLHGIISGAQCPSLEDISVVTQARNKLELTVKPSDEVLTNFPFLTELNQLLEEPRFSRLKTFHLQVRFERGQRQPDRQYYDQSEEEDLITGVQALFPLLHARGILRWTFYFRSEPEWTLRYQNQ